ncbi:E3 ubiquitin-protein ligase RNF19B-like [Elgaria multicarinata webbii]|uniref:E3 ubiquitin-protein ligase RNF19B-like n=1 Tax=Elgaria multicarinata webbii TaxID=159646 RepID=UPI002FCD442D
MGPTPMATASLRGPTGGPLGCLATTAHESLLLSTGERAAIHPPPGASSLLPPFTALPCRPKAASPPLRWTRAARATFSPRRAAAEGRRALRLRASSRAALPLTLLLVGARRAASPAADLRAVQGNGLPFPGCRASAVAAARLGAAAAAAARGSSSAQKGGRHLLRTARRRGCMGSPAAAARPELRAAGTMKRPKVGPPSAGGAPGLLAQKDRAAPGRAGAGARQQAATATEERLASPGPGAEPLECPLCLLAQPPGAFPALSSCAHRACRSCLQRYLRLEIRERRVPVACPHCPAPLQPADVHQLLLPEAALRDKYEEYLLRRLLAADPATRWCPAPDCSYAVLAYGCAECPRLVCGRQDCGAAFCYHCRQLWHPDSSCQQAWCEWQQQAPPAATALSTQLAPGDEEEEEETVAAMTATAQDLEAIKLCPRCGAFIMKMDDGSCNRMSCTVCGCLFCWLCMREITDVHFLSPSGCTFWGKRPWSRTRKALWRLGMVLGAPMVISLVAGLAVPVITLGIPIYTGKKVLSHGRKSKLSGCQQCLSVGCSFLLSLFVSPVITAITVGVGVPLLLTYVYGVVVLSLCRNRWGRGSAQRKAGEHSTTELENFTKLNELLAVLPTPGAAEAGGRPGALPLPSRSASCREDPCQKERESQSASMGAPTGSTRSQAQAVASHRGGLNVVHVEIEAEPPSAHERSLRSAASDDQSCSADSPACTSESCSLAGVTTE